MRPFPATDESGSLVPGFALYGQDFFHPEKTPLIFDLIGDEDPLSFILESIMLPIIRHWVACFRHFGYLLEPHGQNILLEVDGHARVNRIIHRDLNVAIDTRRRRDIGLFDDGTNDYNRMETNEFNSITYDMFMGGHFFDRIVAALQEKHPTINVEDFRRPCRDEFSRIFPEHGEYLPKNVQYFSEKRDQAGKPLYSVTGQAPVWRPSV